MENKLPRPRREDVIAVITLGLAIGLFFGPMLLQTDKLIASPLLFPPTDIGGQHWSDLLGYANSLRQGTVAIWDPQAFLGRPLAGDTGTLFLYPFVLLFVFLPPTLAFNVFYALHFLLAAVFMFLFLRVGYRVSSGAAVFAGLAFAFMPKFIAHAAIGHVGVIAALAWAPAVLLCLKLAFDGSLLAAALAGFALAIQLPTHIQEPYYIGVIASVFWLCNMLPGLWRWIRGDSSGGHRTRWLFVVYGVWLASFALLGAVVLGPLLELLPYNSRGSFTLEDANYLALPIHELARFFRPGDIPYGEEVIFLGVLPIFWGLVGAAGSKFSTKWLWAGLTAFALVYMLGTATPLFELAFNLVPGFRILRIPTRIWFFGGLAVAVLAGLGLEALNTDWQKRLSQWQKPLIGGLGLSFLMAGYVIVSRLWNGDYQTLLGIRMLILMVTAGLMAAWLTGKLSGRIVQWAAVALLMVELLPFDVNYIAMIDPKEAFLRPQPELDFVANQPGLFRTYLRRNAPDVPEALAYENGLELVNGYRSFQVRHAVSVIDEAVNCPPISYSPILPSCLLDVTQVDDLPEVARKLGELNVKFVVTEMLLEGRYFQKVFDADYDVYLNTLWQPRFQLSPAGDVTLVEKAPGYYRLNVKPSEAGSLVVRETWLPGWQVTVDNQAVKTEMVDGAFIGVNVPEGSHEVVLEYDPIGWRIGVIVSVASLSGLVLWVIIAGLHKRRPVNPQPLDVSVG